MDKIIVTMSGALLIAFTYWFFLHKKSGLVSAVSQGSTGKLEVDIVVNGGYSPETISIPANQTTKINFLRRDPSNCLEEIVIPDFKIRKNLPLGEKISIEITPEHAGEFNYSCGMNMFHGKIIAE